MNREEIEKKSIAIVAELLNKDVSTIKIESKISEDLGADSLDVVELLMAFEDEFGITIEDEDAVNIKTILDIVQYIENNI